MQWIGPTKSGVVLFLFFSQVADGGVGGEGVALRTGWSMEVNQPVFAASYFHPVLIPQVSVDGGVKVLFGVRSRLPHTETDVVSDPPGDVLQFNLGLRAGDYIFAEPRLTYNLYSNEGSAGWGIESGALFPVSPLISLGFSVAYDKIFGPPPINGSGSENISLNGAVHLHVTE